MVLVLLVSSAVVLVLTATVVAQRRRITDLTARVDDPMTRTPELITIEIHNHVELAADRTGLARPLSRVAPGLIRSLVHKETLKLLRVELADQGVDADVRLRRLPARPSSAVEASTDAPADVAWR